MSHAYEMLHWGLQAIAPFDADQHKEVIMHIRELAVIICSGNGALACLVVEASPKVRGSHIDTNTRNIRSGVSSYSAGNRCLGWRASRRSCQSFHDCCQNQYFLIYIARPFYV
ncbi:hypothetical protein BDR07DRAFT_813245 [Suillus spraguei]|nr:hypothetical protein BDR07DRAFT_813245 [Suillus spraguei]